MGSELYSRPPLLQPGWIVAVTFTLFPLWWFLGFSAFVWSAAAIPLWFWILSKRSVRYPPTTGVFAVFLGWVLLSAVKLDRFTRVLTFSFRFMAYLTAIGLAIYVFNERRVTVDRLVRWVAWLWVASIVGGYLGLVIPHGRISPTLASLALPQSFIANDFVGNLARPSFAQVQQIGGLSIPRPRTLYSFTNEWGGNVGLLTPFFVSSFLYSTRRSERKFAIVMMIVAVPPMVFSVNRGLWLSLAILIVMIALRSFARGRTTIMLGTFLGVCAIAAIIAFTPLRDLVSARSSESDTSARTGIYKEAWQGALESPVLGWGGPRPSRNPYSPSIGTHGHMWLVMFSQGLIGLALYAIWALTAIGYALRPRDKTSLVLSAVVVIGATQAVFYNLLPMSIPIILLAVGLIARCADETRRSASRSVAVRQVQHA